MNSLRSRDISSSCFLMSSTLFEIGSKWLLPFASGILGRLIQGEQGEGDD